MSRQTLPGFLLTIEDNAPATEALTAVKDVYMIYGVLPETMTYTDEDGNTYDKFIDPNTPILISSVDEAIKTLEASDIALTRETRNMISLLPTGTNIALCRIVTRGGESPNVENLVEFYEALDFAFEETENYPIKEIYVAGLSLDKAVALEPNSFSKRTVNVVTPFEEETLEDAVIGIKSAAGGPTLQSSKTAVLKAALEKSEVSLSQAEGKGVYDVFKLYLNGKVAQVMLNGEKVDFASIVTVDYSNPETPSYGSATGITGAVMAIVDGKTEVNVTGNFELIIDEDSVVEITGFTVKSETTGAAVSGVYQLPTAEVYAVKASSTADILTRILEHNSTITATQNPCLTFLSPEPPRNQSKKAIEQYVERCLSLREKVRTRTQVTKNGRKQDLGMFLSSVVGVNKYGALGGLYGNPQATVASTEGNKIVTKNVTTAFDEGDKVEVYSHDKLDIHSVSATVTGVRISDVGTTEITLDIPSVPGEVTGTKAPKYIMNVNNKDENGNYISLQYSAICAEAGIKRAPAGIVWPGECQLAFSGKQLDKLNAAKYCVVSQRVGTTQGEVDKSQLMTDIKSQFQDYENIATVYNLVSGAKAIGMKYKGERIKDGHGLAMIKKEIEGAVFNPAVDVSIYSGYDLTLTTRHLQNVNGKKEKALFIDFTVTEIETMKLLRMTARLA